MWDMAAWRDAISWAAHEPDEVHPILERSTWVSLCDKLTTSHVEIDVIQRPRHSYTSRDEFTMILEWQRCRPKLLSRKIREIRGMRDQGSSRSVNRSTKIQAIESDDLRCISSVRRK
jgi:hypothetical protein